MVLEEWLPEHVETNDDLTLEEHRKAIEEEFSTSAIGTAIAGLPKEAGHSKEAGR
jgi:hypothetical protein